MTYDAAATRAGFPLSGRALADLGQQVAALRHDNSALRRRLSSVEAVLTAVVRQVEACEAALQFYADLQSYAGGEAAPVLDDSGFKARLALYKRRERLQDTPGDGATERENS